MNRAGFPAEIMDDSVLDRDVAEDAPRLDSIRFVFSAVSMVGKVVACRELWFSEGCLC